MGPRTLFEAPFAVNGTRYPDPMALPPKVCPACESEYLHSAIVCAHCEVALVHPDELAAAPAPEDLPPAADLSLLRAAGAAWALRLSERLVEEEIPHRLEPLAVGEAERDVSAGPYGVYVREADLPAARRVDAAHLAREMPDAGALEPGAFDEDACPACGDPLSPGDAECGGCGLALGPVE